MKRWLVITLGLLCMLVPEAVLAAETVVASNAWQFGPGIWSANGNSITNTDTSKTNTNAYARISQQGTEITYEWTITFKETAFASGPAAGMHFMSTDGANDTRGLSYLVFQDKSFIRLYRPEASKLMKKADFPTPEVAPGQVHQYRVVFNTQTGTMVIWRDGEAIGSWTDPTPISGADFISLRANMTVTEFRDIKVTVK